MTSLINPLTCSYVHRLSNNPFTFSYTVTHQPRQHMQDCTVCLLWCLNNFANFNECNVDDVAGILPAESTLLQAKVLTFAGRMLAQNTHFQLMLNGLRAGTCSGIQPE